MHVPGASLLSAAGCVGRAERCLPEGLGSGDVEEIPVWFVLLACALPRRLLFACTLAKVHCPRPGLPVCWALALKRAPTLAPARVLLTRANSERKYLRNFACVSLAASLVTFPYSSGRSLDSNRVADRATKRCCMRLAGRLACLKAVLSEFLFAGFHLPRRFLCAQTRWAFAH